MALLKKGSKGKEVEKLQEMLNKAGAKPPLKVDGIFGPLTDKALRAAQTKLKLEKVDGKAGEYTMAALSYGKPLPEMKVRDLSKEAAEHKMIRAHNEKMMSSYSVITKEAVALAKILSEYDSSLQFALDCMKNPRAEAAAAADTIAKVQADYHKHLLKNPAAAEKCAKAAESAYPSYEKAFDTLEGAVATLSATCSDFRKQITKSTNKIDAELAAMNKRVEATKKAQQKLLNS